MPSSVRLQFRKISLAANSPARKAVLLCGLSASLGFLGACASSAETSSAANGGGTAPGAGSSSASMAGAGGDPTTANGGAPAAGGAATAGSAGSAPDGVAGALTNGSGGTSAAGGLSGDAGTAGSLTAAGGMPSSCPAGAFICEGFESYATGVAPNGIWTKTIRGTGNTQVDATRAASGSKALHVTGTLNGDVANIVTPLSIPAGTVFVRFMMYTVSYPASAGIHSRLARIGTTADTGNADSAYSLSSYNGTAIEKINSIYMRDTTTNLNAETQKNRWLCLEYEIDETGGVGKVAPHIWLDGKALTLSVAGSSTHGQTSTSWDPIPFQKFTLGLEGFQADTVKADFWVDDLMIAPQRIGCPTK